MITCKIKCESSDNVVHRLTLESDTGKLLSEVIVDLRNLSDLRKLTDSALPEGRLINIAREKLIEIAEALTGDQVRVEE